MYLTSRIPWILISCKINRTISCLARNTTYHLILMLASLIEHFISYFRECVVKGIKGKEMADKSTQVRQPLVKPQPNPSQEGKQNEYLIFYSELKLTFNSRSVSWRSGVFVLCSVRAEGTIIHLLRSKFARLDFRLRVASTRVSMATESV